MSPEIAHLKIIEALMKQQGFINNPKTIQFWKSNPKLKGLNAEDEVGNLKGYQYLTNNLLLTLNGNLAKDINALMSRIDKLEKIAGLDLSETNLEMYWWYEKMNEIEKKIRKNRDDIKHLVQENWVIMNEMKNINSAINKEMIPEKEVAEVTKNATKEDIGKIGNNEKDMKKLNEDMIEVKNQVDFVKNSFKEIKDNIAYLHDIKHNLQEPVIEIKNSHLESAFDSFCQFAVQINDKISEISKKVLSNEYKLTYLDDKINNNLKENLESAHSEQSNGNDKWVASEVVKNNLIPEITCQNKIMSKECLTDAKNNDCLLQNSSFKKSILTNQSKPIERCDDNDLWLLLLHVFYYTGLLQLIRTDHTTLCYLFLPMAS